MTENKMKNLTAEEWLKYIYECAEKANIEPKEIFKTLYLIFIGKDHGPRIGWLLASLDPLFIYVRLNEVVNSFNHESKMIDNIIETIENKYTTEEIIIIFGNRMFEIKKYLISFETFRLLKHEVKYIEPKNFLKERLIRILLNMGTDVQW